MSAVDNLVFACVAPHGPLLVPLVGGAAGAKAAASRAAMEELGRRMAAAQPDTIVIFDTHSVLVDGAISLLDSARVYGAVGTEHPGMPEQELGPHFSLAFEVDRDLTTGIYSAARAMATPVARVRYFLDSTPLSIAWGSLVPLWFLGATLTPSPRVVVAGTPRRDQLPWAAYVDFGRALHTAIVATERRIAVVISTDMAHAHAADSIYGFDPAAAESDAAVLDAVRAHALDRLLGFDQDWVNRVAQEAVRPLLALHGLLEGMDWQAEVLSYEVPTYFGMMCAAYHRRQHGA